MPLLVFVKSGMDMYAIFHSTASLGKHCLCNVGMYGSGMLRVESGSEKWEKFITLYQRSLSSYLLPHFNFQFLTYELLKYF